MDNYSCLDYWYDFCKKIQNTCEQFIALFNENESENKNDPPYHRYSPIPQDIIEPKVIKKVSVTPKEVIIDIEKLLNSNDTKIQNIPTLKIESNNKIQNVITHETFEEKAATSEHIKDLILINQYEDDFEVLDMV